MERHIVDVPRLFMLGRRFNWRVDWRGQAPLEATDGSEQVVFNRFPMFVGSPEMTMPTEMIGAWRALVLQAQGRVGAYRMRMVDPVSTLEPAGDWRRDWRAYQAGFYVEPRPQVECPAGAAAGATSIIVDETTAPRPIRVGAFLSYDDWPFAVVSRSGSGANVTLGVQMLRKAIPAGGQIDLFARGVFIVRSDEMGFPEYELNGGATTKFDLREWITR